MVEDIREAALRYHREGRPGKIEVIASKALGPILVGAEHSAHVLTPSVTARGILNMSAVAVVGAQYDARAKG
jgi:hypothetical protein